MAADGGVGAKLAAAKETLRKAKEWAPPLKMGGSSNVHPSYASAAYSAVRNLAKKATSISPQTKKEAQDTATGINWRLKQQKQAE